MVRRTHWRRQRGAQEAQPPIGRAREGKGVETPNSHSWLRHWPDPIMTSMELNQQLLVKPFSHPAIRHTLLLKYIAD